MNVINKENVKLEQYNYLMDIYIDTISKLIDTAYSFNILPFRVIFGMNWIKKHISENRIETLQNGIIYLLENKDIILNFDLTKLDELDNDLDDNISIKSCVNNLKKNNNISNNINGSDDLLDLIIEIKNNTKNISLDNIIIIKKYFELLIEILEQIKKIF